MRIINLSVAGLCVFMTALFLGGCDPVPSAGPSAPATAIPAPTSTELAPADGTFLWVSDGVSEHGSFVGAMLDWREVSGQLRGVLRTFEFGPGRSRTTSQSLWIGTRDGSRVRFRPERGNEGMDGELLSDRSLRLTEIAPDGRRGQPRIYHPSTQQEFERMKREFEAGTERASTGVTASMGRE